MEHIAMEPLDVDLNATYLTLYLGFMGIIFSTLIMLLNNDDLSADDQHIYVEYKGRKREISIRDLINSDSDDEDEDEDDESGVPDYIIERELEEFRQQQQQDDDDEPISEDEEDDDEPVSEDDEEVSDESPSDNHKNKNLFVGYFFHNSKKYDAEYDSNIKNFKILNAAYCFSEDSYNVVEVTPYHDRFLLTLEKSLADGESDEHKTIEFNFNHYYF